MLDSSGKQNEDISKLKGNVSSLDRDKNELQSALDEKIDRTQTLEDQVTALEREKIELKLSISSLEVIYLLPWTTIKSSAGSTS